MKHTVMISIGRPPISEALQKELLKAAQIMWGPKEEKKMTKFYRVTCYTPFMGEENDYYIATNSHDELIAFADDCAYENGLEWCDDVTLEENDMTEDDYFAECGYRIREIDEEEYRNNAWGA